MPLQLLAEKTRQALGVNGNTFQAISLERYQHALDDADSFAAWLDGYRGNLTHLRDALQGFVQATSSAVGSCPLPSLYSERYDTHELRALPHPPLPKGYAHQLNLPTTPNPSAPSSAASTSPGGGGGAAGGSADPATVLQQLPAALSDKFDGHLAVPFELWLQAHKEAKARLAALDALRAKVDAQRLKLHKQGQLFVKKHQERKQQQRSRGPSARSSFEQTPTPATSAASNPPAPHRSRPSDRSRSPVSLAAAATEALALASKAAGDADMNTDADPSNSSSNGGSFARHAVDSAALHTPPCSPLDSFSGFAAAAAASPGASSKAGGPLGTEGWAQGGSGDGGGVDSYAEGLVRLRSFPLVDAPTSMASSSDSRHGSGEQPQTAGADVTQGRVVPASSSTRPSVHAALPVQSAFQGAAAAGAAPVAGGAAMAAATPAAGDAGLSEVSAGSGVQTSREGSAGLDDEESWATAVLHRRGDQGLLQAHEMVERALGPLLSEFSKAEMQLSTLLGWLVTQAVRLRAYLHFIMLSSASAVDGWALPPGLLEPFPADVLLSGDGTSRFNNHQHQHQHHKHSSKHAAPQAPPLGPSSPEPAVPHLPTDDSPQRAPAQQDEPALSHTLHGAPVAADAALHTAQQARLALTAAAQDSDMTSSDINVSTNEAAPSSTGAAVPAQSSEVSTAQQTAVLPAQAGDASPAAGVSPGPSTQLSTAASFTPKGLPQPASTSTMSVGSAVLAAMVRGLSWKSSGNMSGSGQGAASQLSRGGSGPSSGHDVERESRASRASSILGAGRVSRTGSGASSRSPGSRRGSGVAVLAGVPLGEGKEGRAVAPDAFAAPAGEVPSTVAPGSNTSGAVDGAGATAAAGIVAQKATAGAATTASGGLVISSADMRYLAHDRALIDSLSEDSLCEECDTTTATRNAAATNSSSSSKMPAPATAAATVAPSGAAGKGRSSFDEASADSNSSTHTQGRFTVTETVTETDSTAHTPLPADGEGVGPHFPLGSSPHAGVAETHIRPADRLHLGEGRLQGSTAKAASERGLRREQLLLRAAELDSEAASHAAAAAEAGRMAEVYVAEGAEVEGVLRVEVTQERRRLLARQEVVLAELSQLDSTELPRLQAAVADLSRQLQQASQELEQLASQEGAAGMHHRTIISRRSSLTATLAELEASREQLRQQLSKAEADLASKQCAAKANQEEIEQLQEKVWAATAAKTRAQQGLTSLAAGAAEAGKELAEADVRLLSERGELTRLREVELPRLEQHLREVQARLCNLKQSEHRVQAQARLTELERRLQLDKEEVAEWEATCSSMSGRLSGLTSRASTLTCEASTYTAKSVAAAGLQRAEETRAAAAGAEAEALKAAAAAMADREATLSTSTETVTTFTSRTAGSTTQVQQTQTPAAGAGLIDTHDAGMQSGSTSSSLAQATGAKMAAETEAPAASEETAGAVVPNRLAAAGPLQQVAAGTVAAAAEETTEQQQGLLDSDRQQHAAAATQTPSDEVAAATAPVVEDRAALAAATAAADGSEQAGEVTHAAGVQHTMSDSATQTADAEVRGAATQPPAAAGAVLESAGKGHRQAVKHGAAAAPADKLQQQQAAMEAKPLLPGPLALAGESAAAPAGPTDAAATTAAASNGKVTTSTGTAAVPTAAGQSDPRLQQAEPETGAAVMRGAGQSAAQHTAQASRRSRDDAAGSSRQYAAGGQLPTALPPTSAEVEGGGVPGVAGSVASMASSGRSSQRRHRSWLKHFQPQKAKPEEHLYLPLGGMDVDLHRRDQAPLPTQPWPATSPKALRQHMQQSAGHSPTHGDQAMLPAQPWPASPLTAPQQRALPAPTQQSAGYAGAASMQHVGGYKPVEPMQQSPGYARAASMQQSAGYGLQGPGSTASSEYGGYAGSAVGSEYTDGYAGRAANPEHDDYTGRAGPMGGREARRSTARAAKMAVLPGPTSGEPLHSMLPPAGHAPAGTTPAGYSPAGSQHGEIAGTDSIVQQAQGQHRGYGQQGGYREQQYGQPVGGFGLEQSSQGVAAAEYGGRDGMQPAAQSAASVSSMGDGYKQEEALAAYRRGPMEHGGGKWRRKQR